MDTSPEIQNPESLEHQELIATICRNLREETLPLNEEDTRRVIHNLASEFHDDWRKSRRTENRPSDGQGNYEPRWKNAGNDPAWLYRVQSDNSMEKLCRENPDTGEYEVDIANSSYDQLPENWKRENREAAQTAVNIVHGTLSLIGADRQLTEEWIEEKAALIHNAWLLRNPWVQEQSDNPQRLPYNQLPEEEKAKDRNQVFQVLRAIASN